VVGTEPDFTDGGCKDRGYYTDSGNTNGYLAESDCNTNCLLRYNFCCDIDVHTNDPNPWKCDPENPQKIIGFYAENGVPTSPDSGCVLVYLCGENNGCCRMGYFNQIPYGSRPSAPYNCENNGVALGSCDETTCQPWYECDPSAGKKFIKYDTSRVSKTYSAEEIGYCDLDNEGNPVGEPCNCKRIWRCDPTKGPTFLRYSMDPPGENEYDDVAIMGCLEKCYCSGGTAPDYSDGACSCSFYDASKAPEGSTNPTTCNSICGSPCGWLYHMPHNLSVTLYGIVDHAYGTGFSSMNGDYTLTMYSLAVEGSLPRARYASGPDTDPNWVAVLVDCDGEGRVRYYGFVRYGFIYGMSFIGSFVSAQERCYASDLYGGNPSYIDGNMSIVCVPPPV